MTGESAGSCAPIAEKSELILETSAATAVIFVKMSGIAEATSVNIARTSARALRRLSYAQIGRHSESIPATSGAIAVTFVETFVIDVATFATTGKIDDQLAETSEHGGT